MGVLYLLTFVTSIPALVLYEPALRHPVGFVAGDGNVSKYLLTSRRAVELLLLLARTSEPRSGRRPVDHEAAVRGTIDRLRDGADSSRARSSSSASSPCSASRRCNSRPQVRPKQQSPTRWRRLKDWTFILGPGLMVGWGNGLILGYMMYRTQLVPRPWTWLGLIGGPLIDPVGNASCMFGAAHPPAARLPKAFARFPSGMGAVPRHLLHHLGFQARGTDSFREHLTATADYPRRTPHTTATGATDALSTDVATSPGPVRGCVRLLLSHRMADEPRCQ